MIVRDRGKQVSLAALTARVSTAVTVLWQYDSYLDGEVPKTVQPDGQTTGPEHTAKLLWDFCRSSLPDFLAANGVAWNTEPEFWSHLDDDVDDNPFRGVNTDLRTGTVGSGISWCEVDGEMVPETLDQAALRYGPHIGCTLVCDVTDVKNTFGALFEAAAEALGQMSQEMKLKRIWQTVRREEEAGQKTSKLVDNLANEYELPRQVVRDYVNEIRTEVGKG